MPRVREPYYHSGVHLTDTILVIEDVEILVQRTMLSILSPVFERLLFGDFKENNETIIVLNDVQLDTMYDCLDIMHGVDLKYTPGQMCADRLNNLLLYADRFDINLVRLFCQWELNIQSKGQEVDRYLLACQHCLDDSIKDHLFSFLTAEKLSFWTKDSLASGKESMLALNETDLARLFAICTGKKSSPRSQKKQRSNRTNPVTRNMQIHDVFTDAFIQVDHERIPVNSSMLCYLSPFFYNHFGGSNKQVTEGEVVKLENVNARALKICLEIIHGQPIANQFGQLTISGGKITGCYYNPTLFELLDLSCRLSLPAVRAFCSMQMALPSKGEELATCLLACHFNLPCKTVLLSRLSSSVLHLLDSQPSDRQSVAPTPNSPLQLDILNFDVDDIRSLLALSSHTEISPIKTPTTTKTGVWTSSTLFRKSAHTDIVLVADEIEFHVNRTMLALLSPYFNKLLVLDAKKETTRFVLDGVEASVFGLCLHIIYGKMPEWYKQGKLSSSYMIGLLEYAHRFELTPVKLFCDHEMFENEKGHKMDRFLLTSSCYPEETETRISHLTDVDVLDWLEKGASSSLPQAQCPVKLTLQQLARLTKLLYGEPLRDERTSVHIRPSSISKTALNMKTKKVYLTVCNKGTHNVLLQLSGDSNYNSAVKVDQYTKLDPGATSRILVEKVNGQTLEHTRGLHCQLFIVPDNNVWNNSKESQLLSYWGSNRISTIALPFVL